TQRNFARGNGAASNEGAHIRAGNVNAGPGKQSSVLTVMGLDISHRTALSQSADECDAFNSDIDDEPNAQSIFMANLSSAGPTNQQAGPSNASILFEVHDLENAIDSCDDNQDEHKIHNELQQKNTIDLTKDHMGNSNVTPYEHYFLSMEFLLY
nr:hypothetical protein [Tanacetum cinerariifolium]